MPNTNIIAHTVTTVSGTAAIVSASTSKTANYIKDVAPLDAVDVVQRTQGIVDVADVIGLCSFVVLLASFVWKVYADRKLAAIEQANSDLEREKFEYVKKKDAKLKEVA